MYYLALIYGKGEGCKRAIACNKDWVWIQADSDKEAIQTCRDLYKAQVSGSDLDITKIELVSCIGKPIVLHQFDLKKKSR